MNPANGWKGVDNLKAQADAKAIATKGDLQQAASTISEGVSGAADKAADKISDKVSDAAAQLAEEKRVADATIAAEAKEVSDQARSDRAEVRSDAIESAHADRRFQFWSIIVLPIAMAVIAGLQLLGLRYIDRLGVKVDEYHHEVNSMKDELVQSVKEASHAKGVIEGKKANDSR